jgi:hypothetical protein
VYPSPNIIRVIIKRREAHVGENRNTQGVLVRQPETIHIVDLGRDGRITVKWILKRKGRTAWIGFIWHRTGTSGRLLWTY